MLGHVCQLHYYGGGVVAYHSENWEIGQAPVPQGAVPQNWPSSDLFHRWWGCGGHPHLRSFKGGGPETCARCGVRSHACGADGWCSAASRVASWCLAPIPARQTPAEGDGALPQCHCRGATGMDGPNWSGTATITGGWRWPGWWQAVPLGSSPGSLAELAGGARGYSARSKIFGAEGRCQTGFLPAAEANSPCADHRPAKHWPRGRQHAEVCLESPLAFIQGLCDQVDFAALPATSAMQQWHQLRSLICGSDGAKVGQHDKKTSVANRLPAADSSGVSNSVFYPNKKVQGLPTVFEGEDVIQLQCGLCSATISSSWFFRHPGTQQISVLVPQHGHLACGKKLGKLSPWIPASDVTPKPAKLEILTLCPHNRELRNCTLCGGSRICEHQKRRDRCATCRCLPRPLKMARAEHQDSASKNIWLNHIKPIYIIYLNHPEAV